MMLKRCLGAFMCLVGLCLVAGTYAYAQGDDKDKDKLIWKAFDEKGKTFYQELDSSTNQKMKVMGQEIEQVQKQTFLISWTVQDKDADGNWVVVQKIEGVKMEIDIGGNKVKYDSTEGSPIQNPMTDFFKTLATCELSFHVKPADMTVTKIDGRKEFLDKLVSTNPQMKDLLNNILSEDALKNMAEPTWGAIPPAGVKKGDTWKKPSSLDLGSIGKYETTFTYTFDGIENKQAKINATVDMKYKAPTGKSGLPFTIKDANLVTKSGSGTALFNVEKGRFDQVDMKMQIAGDLKIEVGSMETQVNLDQTQTTSFKTFDAKPAAWEKKDQKK